MMEKRAVVQTPAEKQAHENLSKKSNKESPKKEEKK